MRKSIFSLMLAVSLFAVANGGEINGGGKAEPPPPPPPPVTTTTSNPTQDFPTSALEILWALLTIKW